MKLLKKLLGFFWNKSLLVFLVIGAATTLLGYAGSFLLSYYAGWGLYASTALMYAIGSVPSFYFNRKYSFHSKAPLGQSLLRFSSIIVVCFHLSFVLNYFAMPWLYAHWFPGIAPLAYTLLRLLGIQVVFTLLNYIAQRLWAFREA